MACRCAAQCTWRNLLLPQVCIPLLYIVACLPILAKPCSVLTALEALLRLCLPYELQFCLQIHDLHQPPPPPPPPPPPRGDGLSVSASTLSLGAQTVLLGGLSILQQGQDLIYG